MKKCILMMFAVLLLFPAFYASADNKNIDKLTPEQAKAIENSPNLTKSMAKELGLLPSNEKKLEAPSPFKTAKGKTVYGYCIFDESWGQTANYGVYSFDLSNPTTITKVYPNTSAVCAGLYFEDYLYVYFYVATQTGSRPVSFSKINMSTGEVSLIKDYSAMTYLFSDMTYDYTTNTAFFINRTSLTASSLGKVDLTNGNATIIGETGTSLMTLACDKSGQLYGVNGSGKLMKVNKENGSTTEVGNTGITPEYIQSMDFDRDDNTLYWAMCDDDDNGKLVTVNTTTGLATVIGTLGNNAEIVGLHIPFTVANQGAPAAVSNLQVTPGANGAMNAAISFKTPALNVGGTTLASITKVEIFRNDVSIKVFDNPAVNSQLSFTDNVTEAGQYAYKVVATNSIGEGPAASKTVFVGEDFAGAPTNVVLTNSEGKGVITWTAPTTGLNGGWFNASELSYRITRLPDNVIVAPANNTTSFTDNTITQLGNYSYKVQSRTMSGPGGDAVSNSLIIGDAFSVPYTCQFTESQFPLWTILDLNSDNRTWGRDGSGAAKYSFSSDNSGDDWLISPPIKLEAGKSYRIKYDIKSQSSVFEENLKVTYGQGTTAAAQSNVLATYENYKDNNYKTFSHTISPTVAGQYNIGFYAFSDPDMYAIYATNIVVEELLNNDLMAVSINGPMTPMVGKEYSYHVKVKNNGTVAQNNYTVQLLNGETVLDTNNVTESLNVDESTDIVLKWTPSTVGTVELKGKVILANDEAPANNITSPITVDVQESGDDEWASIGTEAVPDKTMPINFYYKNSVSQTIYLEDEIGFSGMIKKIVYSYNNSSEKEFTKPLKVYLGTTELSTVPADKFIPENELTLVFDGEVSVSKGEGEIAITLDTPYIYGGDGNLCVTVIRPLDAEYIDKVFFPTSGIASRTRIYNSDSTPFDWTQPGTIATKMPNIKILATTAAAGKIEGTVKCNNTAVEGVKVAMSPLGLTATTDANGKYAFNYVPAGTYSLTATKHGYVDKVEADVVSVAEQTTTKDIAIVEVAKYTVSGTVKNTDNANVEGAIIVVKGYEDYEATTNASGAFTIADVYKATGYSIKVTKKGLAAYTGNFDVVDANVTLPTITLSDVPNPPTSVVATASESKVDVTWGEPSDATVFRYDDGVVDGQLGFQNGTAKGIMGSVHRVPATLNSMSWWTVGTENAGGPHNKVNVFVMDLNNAGEPTSTVLFSQMDVTNTDDQWMTFRFPTAVECPRGFMIAISYTGFAGIGVDAGTSTEWPFVANGNYYAGDYTSGKYTVLGGEMSFNFLIRAEGVPSGKADSQVFAKAMANNTNSETANMQVIYKKGESFQTPELNQKDGSKSLKGYKVWRLLEADQANEAKWTLLTTSAITATTYADNSWASAPTGAYKYAVKAVYSGDIMSQAAFSKMIAKGMEAKVTVNVKTNTTNNEADGATVTLTNNDNNAEHVYTATVASGKVVIPNVWKGTYKVNVQLNGFSPAEATNVAINDDIELSYTLNEIIVKPYNLDIIPLGGDMQTTNNRTLVWNVSNSIEDDFERHENFKINSPGDVKWSYIDGDGKATYGFQGIQFPNTGSPMAYIVFVPSATTPATDGLVPHSGDKILASFAAEAPNQDYIISPKLSFSTEFTLSFWAKTFVADYGLERMRVGYSTTTNEASAFTNWLTAGNYVEVPVEAWTKFSYKVPAEAKYVTIECVSNDAFIFLLDDIFIGIEKPSRAFVNYKVYLDGEPVGETTGTSYDFTGLKKGKFVAGVEAVYTSGVSERATIQFETYVGINELSEIGLTIYPNPVRDIMHVDGDYTLLEVYDSTGKMVLTANGESSINVSNLTKGVYVVKAYKDDKVGTYKMVK